MLPLIFALIFTAAPVQESAPRTIVVEVYQPPELPMGMSDAVITNTNGRFVLKGLLSNYSEFRPLGIRYSIAVIDSENSITLVTQSEAVRLAPYQAKRVAFKMSQKVILRKGERFVLMLEQVVTTDYIWEVLTAKDSLAAYIAGDYSVVPRISRVPNQVDVRPRNRVIY
jgi:hypothetical protein